ncbi:MAG: hypothetical protein KF861_14045, partial [Planctomycetaceae bacterium]|nr:hypothetical protein [Planctomycetaceae bacterium]
PIDTILASFADDLNLVVEQQPADQPLEESGEQQERPVEEDQPVEEPPPVDTPRVEEVAPQPDAASENIAETAPETTGPESPSQTSVDLSQMGHRSASGKALLLETYGGSEASESAVQRALEWFSSRQRSDGSWNFNDVGPCGEPGEIDNPMGATAYVLLCYLGAGQTHQSGLFKSNVRAGLMYLLAHGRRVPAGGDFRGANCREHDNFYVQAAVAMALSEAYQLTKDRRFGLGQAAQSAIDFLCHAQDPQGGGWRYKPREPGCTSVTALVMLALKSGLNAGLKVPPRVLDGISHYLDTVRSDPAPAGRYAYRVAEPVYKSSTTAMALLCRMHLGWTKDDEELRNGVALLNRRGPYNNLYYCYYATQVMRDWGGEEWQRWNGVMRDDLVRTQVVAPGPEYGSWAPRDRSGTSGAGGRLFTTCLATMTLEVYYRHLPLYGLPEDDKMTSNKPADFVADADDE